MRDLLPGAWTVSMNCRWKGEMLSTDMFCTMGWDDSLVTDSEGMAGSATTSTFTWAQIEIATAGVCQAVAVISGTAESAARTKTAGDMG